ncbi:MAG: hypothetical protein V4657_09390 [Pseudomonadota bacterium]
MDNLKDEVTQAVWSDELPPHGVPVIAEFHEWNVPTNPPSEHVVWLWEGEVRQYPQTEGIAYWTRWRHLPVTNARPADDVLRDALERIATVDMGGGFLGAQACREVARAALAKASQ